MLDRALEKKGLFNPSADDSNICLMECETTNLIYLNTVKYQWAYKLYKRMREMFWTPEIVDLTQDKSDLKNLTEPELKAYKGILSFLVFLDSLQSNNLANIVPYITAPEVVMCLVEQESQEVNHCLIAGTEILTDKGFKDFRELTKEDKVAAYHENGKITFETPIDIINSQYDGILIEVKSQNSTQIVTTNHRIICYENNKLTEYQASNLLSLPHLATLQILVKTDDSGFVKEDIISTKEIKANETSIHCVTVSTGMIVCRYNESVFVTGNSMSYQTIFESIFSPEETDEIYYFWKDDETLLKRNAYIAEIYQKFVDEPNYINFLRMLVADLLLEGLYFYNGFQFFYNLASRGLMAGTSDMIRLINADEFLHIGIFRNIILEIMKKLPKEEQEELKQMILEMTEVAIEQEISWSLHIMGSDILGINPDSIKEYTYYLANTNILQPFGIDKYKDYKNNPYKHLEKIANVEGGSEKKGNFFEANSNSYSQVNALGGFAEF